MVQLAGEMPDIVLLLTNKYQPYPQSGCVQLASWYSAIS
jgi:hypothetical protein